MSRPAAALASLAESNRKRRSRTRRSAVRCWTARRCAACRADVAELRIIRRLLTGSAGQPSAPTELSHRLVSIAGAEANTPLWSRPFRRTRAGSLPSPRRAMRLRTAAAGVAFGTLVVAAGGLGYLAAPASTMAVISDPGTEAQAEFSSTIAQFPQI